MKRSDLVAVADGANALRDELRRGERQDGEAVPVELTPAELPSLLELPAAFAAHARPYAFRAAE